MVVRDLYHNRGNHSLRCKQKTTVVIVADIVFVAGGDGVRRVGIQTKVDCTERLVGGAVENLPGLGDNPQRYAAVQWRVCQKSQTKARR